MKYLDPGIKPLLYAGIIFLVIGLNKAGNNDQIIFQCETGWTNINFMCYKTFNTSVPWDLANGYCKRMQSNLVKISDYWSNKEIGDEALKHGLSQYWIGFNQIQGYDPPSGAHWGDSEETNLKQGFWANHNPDSKKGKCSFGLQTDDGAKWAIANCNEEKSFVCEKQACTSDTFMCSNSRCINKKYLCDGNDDCRDGSDEQNCPQHCRYFQTGSSGTLNTVNHPQNYPKNSFCIWKIQSDVGTLVKISFSDFFTEENVDVVDIFVGSLSESEAFFKYRLSGNSIKQTSYTSSNNQMIIKFMSDNSVEYTGFKADWTTVPSSFEHVELKAHPSGNVSVYDIMNNDQNTWTIRTVRRRTIVTLEKVYMELMREDQVIVYDGDSMNSQILAIYNKTNDQIMGPLVLQSTGESLMILLRSRGYFSKGGFVFSYQEGCEVEIKDQLYGEVMSPGYNVGDNYPNSIDCQWIIDVPNNQSFLLKFDTNFDIDSPYDILYIHKKSIVLYNSTNSNSLPKDLKIDEGSVKISFKTNAINNNKGFKAVFSIDCPNPNFNENTITTPSNAKWHYDSTFTVTCKPGYQFYSEAFVDPTGNSTDQQFVSLSSLNMTCLKAGQWNLKTIPRCSKMFCGPVKAIKNGRVFNASGVLFGDFAYYECSDGYTLTGYRTVRCRPNGNWESAPTCTATGCSSLSNITDGQMKIIDGTGTSVGSIVRYSCDSGYELDGIPITQCLKSAKWSNVQPTCKIMKCSEFILEDKIPNSSIEPKGDVEVNKNKTVTCNQGYALNGTSTITCLEDQTFSTLPTCEDIDECQPPGNLNKCDQNCVNTPGSYYCTCNKGYDLGSDNVTCTDINECAINNGQCEQICTNSSGSYKCSCKPGYALFVQDNTMNYSLPNGETGKSSKNVFYIDHSCVPVLCPKLEDLKNGFIQPQTESSHFGDTVFFSCNIGFSLEGEKNAMCSESGTWSNPLPTCKAVECKPDANRVHPNIPYLGFYNFTCEVRGKPKEFRQRQCLYDPLSQDYKLLGDSYICEEIDCGEPQQIPGSVNLTITNTTYGAQYEIKCDDLYQLKGNSSYGNVIYCESDGKWDYGDIKCDGVLCEYPSVPTLGTVSISSFTEGSVATYSCQKEGYSPFNVTQRTCIKNDAKTRLIWDKQMPTCVDTQPPTFENGTCNNTIIMDKYSALNATLPVFSDNSGTFTININPEEAISGFIVTKDMSITYTATDSSGLNVSCTRNIIVRDVPIQISCPSNIVVDIENSNETKTLVFNESMVTVNDSTIPITITLTPRELVLNESNIDNIQTVIARAEQHQTSAECTFHVFTRAKPCSALSKPQVQNASLVESGGTYEYVCKDSYTYPDNNLKTKMVAKCNSTWDVPFTACSKRGNYADYFGKMTMVYEDSTANVADTCATKLGDILTKQLITNTFKPCGTFVHDPKPIYVQSSMNFITKGKNVSFEVLLKKNASKELTIFSEQECYNLYEEQINNDQFKLNNYFKTLKDACATVNLIEVKIDLLTVCTTNNSKQVLLKDYTFCVECPPGSYYDLSSGKVNCVLCPIGEYQDEQNQPSCKKCPGNTLTYIEGGYHKNMCQESCPAGFVSSLGIPPCEPCPKDTYSLNSTTCEMCPTDTRGRNKAATKKDDCKTQCKAGTYSFDGYEPCQPCAKGFYTGLEKQTQCEECDDKTTTSTTGAKNKSSCLSVANVLCSPNPCKNGLCVPLGHLFICDCLKGYTGDLCEKIDDPCSPNPCYYGGKCSVDGINYKCDCPAGTKNTNCEDIIENCTNDTCNNNGICQNRINATKCYCLPGYGGEFCQKVTLPCEKNPCQNGLCKNLGTENFKCDCPPGYKGIKCETQIDNCASSPCLFNTTCINGVNDFSCNCTMGYSGKTCNQRPGLCTNVQCNSGTCVPNLGSDTYTCSCDLGYKYSKFCQFSVKTSNGSEKGYKSIENSSNSACISLCSEDPSCKSAAFNNDTGTCNLYKNDSDACCTVFTKECQNPSGNFWTPWYTIENDVEPFKVKEMLENIGIKVCDGMTTTITQCKSEDQTDDKMRPDKYAMSTNISVPCKVEDLKCNTLDKRECDKYRIRFQCAVSEVMQNNKCEKKSTCDDVHCENGGNCIGLTGECACPLNYEHPYCRVPKDLCANRDCGNGTCLSEVGISFCECNPGFEGDNCTKINECKDNPCDPKGTKASGCQDLINQYYCPCKEGYKGKNCSINIEECKSNPCLHQGVCKDGENDFTCQCPNGWTGKRCEQLVDYCQTNNCSNNATCLNLYQKYYCSCKPNTYGANCSEFVSICKDANPCLNEGNCTEFGGKSECQCKKNYAGIGCQIAVDFCKSEVCVNGGTCIPKEDGFECLCLAGFNGTNCEQKTHDCTTSLKTCEKPKTSICPFGKTGSFCNKDISSDFDLDFYLFEKNGMARMKSPVLVTGTSFSISLWFRFRMTNSKGTFFNLFIIKSNNMVEEKVPVLRISDVGVTFTSQSGKEVILSPRNLKINDGRWNLFTMAIKDSGKTKELRLNNFDEFPTNTDPILDIFGKKCLIVLGCYYDAKNDICVPNKGFYGDLSEVTLYNKYLDHKTDIVQLTTNSPISPSSILVAWGNYQLGRGVRRISPSTVNPNAPPVEQTSLRVENCPAMVNNYGSQARTLLEWNPPTFVDYSEVQQNYRPGTIALWGRYAVSYQGEDKHKNAVLCNFMVYAKENNCTRPDDPYEGTAVCDDHEFPYYSCNISCNANRALTAPAPLLFTCGPTGYWHPEKTYLPMRFPSCGVIKKTVISILVNLEYSISSTGCDATINGMKPKLIETMKNLNAENNFVLCQKADCSDIQWNFTCNDRINAVQNLKVTATVNAKNDSAQNILTEAALDKKSFNYPNFVQGGNLLTNQFSLNLKNTCGEGEALIQGNCVECTPGTYLNVGTKCDHCPVGTYQENVAQTNCTSCPANTTTLGTGNTNITDCKLRCPRGQYFDTKKDSCVNCDIVSYQDLEGQFSCKSCLSGKTTKIEGATSADQCTETCPAGYEFTTNCTACQIGFYRENGTANTCVKCSNKTITLKSGSTSINDCNITACFAGTSLDKTNNTCIECPDGQYQDEKYQHRCKHCPSDRYRTGKTGAQKIEDCKFYCESGFQVGDNETCQSCPRGTYKDNDESFYGVCKICPDSKTTLSVNSTSASNCTIHKCPAGQQPNSTGDGCDPCPLGTYQPDSDEKECLKCNTSYSTRAVGSISPSKCEEYCPSGYERVSPSNSSCKQCEIGYYKDNDLGVFSTCQLCPIDFITEQVASIAAQNCSRANCSKGQYLDTVKNQCIECDYGFYQDEKWNTSCKPCDTNFTTYIKGSKEKASCQPLCYSGYELVNNKCKPCQIGYFRNQSNNGQISCTPCPDPNFVTEKEGAISKDECTIVNCSAGSYRAYNECLPCPLDQYQNAAYQNKCLPCDSGFKTWRNGSVACVRTCPAGEEYVNNTCTPCKIGYYRTENIERCKICPNGFLTAATGAKNDSFCDIPPCTEGQYYDGSKCVKCKKDEYQDKKYQKKCTPCQPGRFTKSIGSKNPLDCLSYCDTKKDNCSSNSTCKDDPSGFKCDCKKNYIQKEAKCIHICDTNYCLNGGSCIRSATATCVCTKYFDGPRCERQLSAQEVSQNSTHSIIGAVVGVLAGILIIILIVTLVCVRMRRKPRSSSTLPKQNSGTSLSTKFAPTYMSANSLAARPILEQEPQVNSYTNAAYDEESDPAIFKA